MRTVVLYTWFDDYGGGVEGTLAAPTLADAKESARFAARLSGTDTIVEREEAEGVDLRRLAVALYNHEGYVRKSTPVGIWIVEGPDPEEPGAYKVRWERIAGPLSGGTARP